MDWDRITDKFSVLGEGMGRRLKGVFGSWNERIVGKLWSPGELKGDLRHITEREPWAQGLSQEEMRAQIVEWKRAVQAEETTLDDCLTDAFALVREASVRTLGLRHFDVQMVGGWVLHKGSIAEMATGEGKTLVATLALSLNALAGRPCYLVTVNDYLAQRDANWMRPIYEYLGLTVGAIQSTMDPKDRKPVYACDIVYGTNNEFGFDYLRDNMKTTLDQQVQSDLYFAIVDEVDSILVDEARTPLIISGPAEEHIGKYKKADQIARKLVRDEHYEVKEKERSASLLEDGILAAQELAGVESFYEPGCEDWPHYIENAIRAHELYLRDKEYVVEVGEDRHTGQKGLEVVIVDEFTGRKMHGRRWSDGLHQAVEVKEGLEPKQETQTLATITFQNYFRMFEKLAGMTGTAVTEAGEFHKIYSLDVIQVPTNVKIARDDNHDLVYRTEKEKWKAICDEIERLREKGQPVLVGTTSVEKSETLSGLLKNRGVPHEVLNARIGQWEREAQIVARAGELGAVTVATNMAGRGTDIKLGGNFEYRLGQALAEAELIEGDVDRLAEIDAIREELREKCAQDEKQVLESGGLYVLGTERHEARRIDNQLRGRSGRQGDAGESRFFLSLQDDLMRIFYRDWVTNMMEKLGMTEGQEIESGMVTRAIAKAQKKVEDRNFEIRKNLLEYDEVMDQQRKTIYGVRQQVLEATGLRERAVEMLGNVVDRSAEVHVEDEKGFTDWCQRTFGFEIPEEAAVTAVDREGTTEKVTEAILERYEGREKGLGDELARRVEQYLLLNAIDSKWKDHLYAVDSLKAGIGLRGYGQQDPKTAYKKEGTELFQNHLIPAIEGEVSSLLLRIQVSRPEDRAEAAAGEPVPAAAAGTLTPRGMVQQGVVAGGPTPEQLAAYQAQVRQARARQAMRGGVAASNAFDVMRRREAAATASKQQPKTSAPVETAQPEYEGVGRNDLCPCGSGKKFKKCHG